MAAEAIRERGVGGRVVIVSEDSERPYHRHRFQRSICAATKTAKRSSCIRRNGTNEQGVELMLQTRATGLDPRPTR